MFCYKIACTKHIKQQFCNINKQSEETCEKFLEKFRNQIKEGFVNELNKREERIKQTEYDKAMLQKHISELRKQNIANQSEIQELEHMGGGNALDWKVFLLRRTKLVTKC